MIPQIDWNLIASELGITNGHAARMRFSRFKQQMEGLQPTRRPRGENHKQQKAKLEKRRKGDGGEVSTTSIKPESDFNAMAHGKDTKVKSEVKMEDLVKEEPEESDYKMSGYDSEMGIDPSSLFDHHGIKTEEV